MNCGTHELLHADDTLLIDDDAKTLQQYMNIFSSVGREYGLQLNWDKLDLLAINETTPIMKPDGTEIPAKSTMIDLGSLLSSDGHIDAEINRRMGMAREEFDLLQQVWKHASITRKRKQKIFNLCILRKLIYGLQNS